MILNNFQTDGLNSLCDKDQLKLLNAIDNLRSQGISYYVSLPQIIVCGDQSSGKSSILEAISGVSFPVKGNLCTRFPTELVLRKTPYESVNVSIVPDQARSEAEQQLLCGFKAKLEGLDGLPTLVEEAKAAMGISPHLRAFSKDLLKIEISGPEQPHLTIVDLPGLIHSETKHQSIAEVHLVHEMVQSYMKERRSIILAVVSAKNDYANQIVLKLARQVDADGLRTIGVITKPDTLPPGSETESTYITLAKNEDIEFRLGWHVLKNVDTDIISVARPNRDSDEEQFFSQGNWQNLPSQSKGIKSLRVRLSQVLLKQIALELPNLIEDIDNKLKYTHKKLQRLGDPRTTASEQREYLIRVSQSYQALVYSAVSGNYDKEFFGDARTSTGYSKRIRAVIQNLNQEFADELSKHGHTNKIVNNNLAQAKGKDIRREDYLKDVRQLMKSTRGRELPGTFNPMIITDLFQKQSSPWRPIAIRHIENVWKVVEQFLKMISNEISDLTTSKNLFLSVFEPALKSCFEILKEKSQSLLAPHHHSHPITYNHYFTETLQNIRCKRDQDYLEGCLRKFFPNSDFNTSYRHEFRIDDLFAHLKKSTERNMDDFACSEALDCMEAYYKVALKRFTDDVAVEVVETELVAKLVDVFSPLNVTLMNEEQISRIAGESEESRAHREQLQKQAETLRKGSTTCKHFAKHALYEKTSSSKEEHIATISEESHTALNDQQQYIANAESGIVNVSAEGIGSSNNEMNEDFIESESREEALQSTVDDDAFFSSISVMGKKGKKKSKGSKSIIKSDMDDGWTKEMPPAFAVPYSSNWN